jgi:hypothetical protein
MNTQPKFKPWPKMARLSRDCIITEKIDGTNAQVFITEDGDILAGSRTRWVTPTDDNFGFAKWVEGNKSELLKLGPGAHYGEWWGQGIQRNYGLNEKRFSMFNVQRWCLFGNEPKKFKNADPRIEKSQEILPPCVGLVPVLYDGGFDTNTALDMIRILEREGSVAAPGFMKPEGIVVFHVAAGIGFKKTIEKDEKPKGME